MAVLVEVVVLVSSGTPQNVNHPHTLCQYLALSSPRDCGLPATTKSNAPSSCNCDLHSFPSCVWSRGPSASQSIAQAWRRSD